MSEFQRLAFEWYGHHGDTYGVDEADATYSEADYRSDVGIMLQDLAGSISQGEPSAAISVANIEVLYAMRAAEIADEDSRVFLLGSVLENAPFLETRLAGLADKGKSATLEDTIETLCAESIEKVTAAVTDAIRSQKDRLLPFSADYEIGDESDIPAEDKQALEAALRGLVSRLTATIGVYNAYCNTELINKTLARAYDFATAAWLVQFNERRPSVFREETVVRARTALQAPDHQAIVTQLRYIAQCIGYEKPEE